MKERDQEEEVVEEYDQERRWRKETRREEDV